MKKVLRLDLDFAYALGVLGLVVNWIMLVLTRLKLDQAAKGEYLKTEILFAGVGLLASLALIIGSAVFIVRRLWPGGDDLLTPGEKMVGYFSLLSLVIAVATRIVSVTWLEIIAVVAGMNSLRYLYQSENRDMQNSQNYKIVSFAAIAIVAISISLSIAVA